MDVIIVGKSTANLSFFLVFLDATTHLYKRSCPSVRPSVGPSVRPSVRMSRVIFERRIWPFLKVKGLQMTS